MHPIEHLLYVSTVLYHLVIPSNPVIALYPLHLAGLGAVPGHVGFHTLEPGAGKVIDSHAYIHYLHHKHVEVNYGDGLVPLDRWFGTFHDGSKASEERMMYLYRKRKARMNAGPKPTWKFDLQENSEPCVMPRGAAALLQ